MRYARPGMVALLTALICLGSAGLALAHRVNVFAYVEGDTVNVECSYSKSDRVRFGDIEVRDAASGKVYLTGKTDEKGFFAFPVPAEARAAKADLVVLLRAGEGHQNECTVKAEEYLSAAPGAPAAQASPAPAAVPPVPATAATPAPALAAAAPADMAALQAAIQAAVEAGLEKKIAPIRKMLVEEKEKGPGMNEIFGGIGYLLGLAGLLAYARSRSGRSRS